MKILALECSASPASCCVYDNDILLGEYFLNIKTTHSQTLLPMVNNLLKMLNLSVSDIDLFAVSNGPGSFTGLRIGISAVKGMAFNKGKNCVPVSTLLGMAYNFLDENCIVCAVMDARCNQVYNALFLVENGSVSRISEDRAMMCEELNDELLKISRLRKYSKLPIILCGDGADMFYKKQTVENIKLASASNKFQKSSGVGLYVVKNAENSEIVSADKLLPVYLRLPQAERELKKKQERDNE